MKRASLPLEPLAWTHRVQDLPLQGQRIERTATAQEREALGRDLQLLGCVRLITDYELRPSVQGSVRMHGRIRATVAQACVVSLEPVEQVIDEVFDVELWPEEDMPELASGASAFDGQEPDDPEPIRGGLIEAGRILREQLAMALDPYPRRAGVEFKTADESAGAEAPASESPFAVLARLKRSHGE